MSNKYILVVHTQVAGNVDYVIPFRYARIKKIVVEQIGQTAVSVKVGWSASSIVPDYFYEWYFNQIPSLVPQSWKPDEDMGEYWVAGQVTITSTVTAATARFRILLEEGEPPAEAKTRLDRQRGTWVLPRA